MPQRPLTRSTSSPRSPPVRPPAAGVAAAAAEAAAAAVGAGVQSLMKTEQPQGGRLGHPAAAAGQRGHPVAAAARLPQPAEVDIRHPDEDQAAEMLRAALHTRIKGAATFTAVQWTFNNSQLLARRCWTACA